MSSGEGGSAAAQAYRQQLAQQGQQAGDAGAAPAEAKDAPAPVAKPPIQANTIEARAAERKKVPGRARVVLPGCEPLTGKMIDISMTGACIMLDDTFPSKRPCMVEYDIFHLGTRHLFTTPAVSVYGILASGKGFKVGFQFGNISEAARKSLAALMK